jgi:hypothetical protein
MASLRREDALARLGELLTQYAEATGDTALLAKVQRNVRNVRVVGTAGYHAGPYGGGWGWGGY